jgi:WD40 repeat protein
MPPASSQILPGTPAVSLQSLSSFVFRQSRYVAYISGSQLNILSSSNRLVQATEFKSTLQSVIAESGHGKLVVATSKEIFVLKPEIEGWSRVWWETTLQLEREDAADSARWLSWGDDGEVLVGGSHALSLFSSLPSSQVSSPADIAIDRGSTESRRPIWAIPIASPILIAEFSPSATMIASCANYDRMVKIWRRLSFEEGLFDYIYLPHPALVTHISWRPLDDGLEQRRSSGLSSRHDDNPEVLHTIAADGVLRIWRTNGVHDLDILKLYATIDLVAGIPQSPTSSNAKPNGPVSQRYVCHLSSDQFCAAVNAAIGLPQNNGTSHSVEHLREIASQTPDIFITLDDQGHMSAWGLQSVGHKRRPEEAAFDQPYHVAHAEGLPIRFQQNAPAMFTCWFHNDRLQLLCHEISANGSIAWWEGDIETLMSPSALGSARLQLRASWCGHDSAIEGLSSDRNTIVTHASHNATQWTASPTGAWQAVLRLVTRSRIIAAVALNAAGLLLTIHASEYVVWDKQGRQIAATAHDTGAKNGTLYVEENAAYEAIGTFVPDFGGSVTRWSLKLSENSFIALQTNVQERDGELMKPLIAPVQTSQITGMIDLVAASLDGQIRTLQSPDTRAVPRDIIYFKSDVNQLSALAANESIIAVASAANKKLQILDLHDGFVEHEEQTDEAISLLSIHDDHADSVFLAIGYAHKIEILVRASYPSSNSLSSTWIRSGAISVAKTGLEIKHLAWTSPSEVVFAAGNSLNIHQTDVTWAELPHPSKEKISAASSNAAILGLETLAHILLAPVPEWSPSFLSTLFRFGNLQYVAKVLEQLAKKLKFWSSGDDLVLHVSDASDTQRLLISNLAFELSDDVFDDLHSLLHEKELPHITRAEQDDLKLFIDTMAYLKPHVNALDRNALIFLFEWKRKLLLLKGEMPASAISANDTPDVDWKTIALVHQSNAQQPLLDILTLHYDNRLTWPIARKLGLLSWLKDPAALQQVFEQVAQSAYKMQQPADPVDGSLYFLALRKKPTLVSLWRIATWHKEQRSTLNFLKRDFDQADARTAAKKNAYALMGKRRFEYSAAFFLLADDPQSAVNALAGQCEDVALAIAVARLYCGDGSDVLAQLIESRLMPLAQKEGNRWLVSWCHSLLAQRKEAADVLVEPLLHVQSIRDWRQDHPEVMILYKQLRTVPSDHEYRAVLRSARILRRMGLWSLSLNLATCWDFKHPQQKAEASNVPKAIANGANDPLEHSEVSLGASPAAVANDARTTDTSPSLLDAFTQESATIAPPVDEEAARKAKAAELLQKLKAKKEKVAAPVESVKKPPPTQFKEPDANSLLDSFGF